MPNIAIDAEDVLKQARKLDGFPRIAKEEFSRGMVGAIRLSLSDIEARAPVGATGQARAGSHGEIRFAMGEEVRAVLTNEARGANGFPYAYALDASPKYRYRGARRKTKGWFRGVARRRRKDILAQFAPVPGRIVKRLEVNGAGHSAGGA